MTGRYERRYNGELSFEIQRIALLDTLKGNMLKGITLDLEPHEITSTLGALLQEQLTASGENKGDLATRVFDKTSNRYLRLTSQLRLPLTRELTRMLDSLDIKYDFSLN